MEQVEIRKKTLLFTSKGAIIMAAGILLVGWLLNTPPGLLGKADAVGYAVCHRIDLRSFHLGERQLPLCARCSGMFLGALLGLIYQAMRSGRRAGFSPWQVWVVLGFFFLAFGFDGVNSYLHLFPNAPGLYEPKNWLRLLTGTGMGLTISAAIYPAFVQTVWRDWENKPVFNTLPALGPLVLLALLLDAVVLTENPLVLYPLALVSAAGVVFLLTLVYSMVWVMIFRLENKAYRLAHLLLPLVGGFGLALLQIIVLDVLRYALTGTWDGFHLG